MKHESPNMFDQLNMNHHILVSLKHVWHWAKNCAPHWLCARLPARHSQCACAIFGPAPQLIEFELKLFVERAAAGQNDCPDGYTSCDGTCLKFFPDSVPFVLAYANCKRECGRLFTPTSTSKHKCAKQLVEKEKIIAVGARIDDFPLLTDYARLLWKTIMPVCRSLCVARCDSVRERLG